MARPLQLLMIEDNPADVLFMQETLKETGIRYDLEVLEDGEVAIDFFRNLAKNSNAKRPDLVILDLNLPKRNGLEVLEEITRLAIFPKLPIAVLTTSENMEDRHRVTSQNVSFVTKPAKLENLFFQVLETLGLTKGVGSLQQKNLAVKQAREMLEPGVTKILLVEDNPVDVLLLGEFLKESKQIQYQLFTAEDLESAFALLAEQNINLIIADLGLPDGQGLEALASLQKEAEDIPIIVLTGLDDETMAVDAVSQGAQDYLVKGQIDSRSLMRAIRYAITRKRAEEFALRSLTSENAVLQEILEQSPISMARFDSDLLITACNPTFCAQLGLNYADVLGENISRIVNFVDRDRWYSTIKKGQPFRLDNCVVTLDESHNDRVWDLTVWPTSSRHDAARGGIALAVDISERLKLERQRDDFTASLAHDIRNPLIGVDRVLTYLEDSKFSKEERAEMVALLKKSNSDVLQMMQNLLDIYHYETGTVTLNLENVPLLRTLKEAISTSASLSLEKQLMVEMKAADSNICVKADPEAIRKLFNTILQNAIFFAGQDSRIEIDIFETNKSATVEIIDKGSRMTSYEREQLFKRFGETQQTNYRGGAGTGLGLYLCKKIVEAHKGAIVCQSIEDRGTRFLVTFAQSEN